MEVMNTHVYAQLDAGGVVIAVTQLAAAAQSPELVEVPAIDAGLIGMRYDAEAGTFVPGPEVAVLRRITPLAFRRRFTAAERAAIEWAAVDRADDTALQRQRAAALRSRLKDQEMAAFIDLDDADVIAGAQEIEAAGLIAFARAQQILTAPIESKELP